MCIAIEYFLDGERKLVVFDASRPELAVRRKNGAIVFYRWRTRGPTYYAQDNTPGWAIKFPIGGWAPLDQVRAGEWQRFDPRPVRILVARFLQVDVWHIPDISSSRLVSTFRGSSPRSATTHASTSLPCQHPLNTRTRTGTGRAF